MSSPFWASPPWPEALALGQGRSGGVLESRPRPWLEQVPGLRSFLHHGLIPVVLVFLAWMDQREPRIHSSHTGFSTRFWFY